jgi:hypothetical protein
MCNIKIIYLGLLIINLFNLFSVSSSSFVLNSLNLSTRTWTTTSAVESDSLLFSTSSCIVASSFLDLASSVLISKDVQVQDLPFSLYRAFLSSSENNDILESSSFSWKLRTSHRGMAYESALSVLLPLASSENEIDRVLTWIQSRAFRVSDGSLVLPSKDADVLLLNHASGKNSNARVSFSDGLLRVHSSRRISAGETILIDYVSDYHDSYVPTFRLFMNYGFFPSDVSKDTAVVRFEWEDVANQCVGLYTHVNDVSEESCTDSGLDITTQGVMPSSMMELRLRTMLSSSKRDRVLEGLYADRKSEMRATRCLLNVLRSYNLTRTKVFHSPSDEDGLLSAASKLRRMESRVIRKYRKTLESVWRQAKRSGL